MRRPASSSHLTEPGPPRPCIRACTHPTSPREPLIAVNAGTGREKARHPCCLLSLLPLSFLFFSPCTREHAPRLYTLSTSSSLKLPAIAFNRSSTSDRSVFHGSSNDQPGRCHCPNTGIEEIDVRRMYECSLHYHVSYAINRHLCGRDD